jgi:hypothetical protein
MAENMPNTPLPFKELDRLCLPTCTRFKFFNDSKVYEAKGKVSHGECIRFETKHIVLLGLMDSRAVKQQMLNNPLLIEVHDRDLKEPDDIGKISADLRVRSTWGKPGPYGVAKFGWYSPEFVAKTSINAS